MFSNEKERVYLFVSWNVQLKFETVYISMCVRERKNYLAQVVKDEKCVCVQKIMCMESVYVRDKCKMCL